MEGLYTFLEGIADNNNREWFGQHRAEYDDLRRQWYEELQQLIDAMSEWLPGMKGMTPSNTSYRFNRDTRFSPDKSPYKVFFSAALSPYGKKSRMSGYYLQLDYRSEENGLYAGVWCPEPAVLKKLRNAIVDNIEEFEEIIHRPAIAKEWPGWVTSSGVLKTAPKGWPTDHPQIELLRLRDLGKFHKCTRRFFEDPSWPQMASERFHDISPLVDFLNYSIEEEI